MDRVEISLSFRSQQPEDPYTERRILLDRDTRTVQIGRTSKRVAELAPAIKNGWLDSPVISREHAELGYDPLKKVVYIMDTESRHGTYLNQIRLEPNNATPLHDGDTLRFGIDIQREDTSYPPPSAMVGILMNPSDDFDITDHNPRTARFSVPEESDSEVSSEDEDHAGIRRTIDTLRKLAGKSHPRIAAETEVKAKAKVPLTIPNPCGPDVIDLDDKADGVAPMVVDLTRESPTREVEHHDSRNDPSALDKIALEPAPMEETLTIASEPHVSPHKPSDQMEHQSRDVHELSDDDGEQDDNDDHDDPESCIYDADDNVPVSGHIAWEADSLPSSPVPVCSGALPDDPPKYDTSEESDAESAQSMFESESDGSQSINALDEDDFEDEDTCYTGRGNHTHEGFDESLEYEEVCEEYSFDKMPCPPDSFSSGLPPPASTPFTNSFPTAVVEGPHKTDPRLSLPSILNNHMPPSQPAPMQAEGSHCVDHHTQRNVSERLSTGSYWQNYATLPQNGDFYLNSYGCVDSWVVPNKAYPGMGELGREHAKTAEPPLTPPSPLITSGEKFLSCPPQEVNEGQRESPELDMSSAWQFQQSKINNASKTKADASLPEPTSGQPTVAAAPAAPDVERAIRVEQLLSEPCQSLVQVSNASKRKADDISDLTDVEKRDEQSSNDASTEPTVSPGGPVELPPISEEPSNKSPVLVTGDTTPHSPKRIRRMAEAARLVALGGAAAGVALFTTLVATAPTFT